MMKIVKILLIVNFLTLCRSINPRLRGTNKEEIDRIRQEAHECKTLLCLGAKAYKLSKFVTIRYINDELQFAQLLKEDYSKRGITKSICTICHENISNDYHGFTTVDDQVIILQTEKPKNKKFPSRYSTN